MDVDLRKLRYFVAVAECSGFRRAAELLHISQPALTRQIRSLEDEMKAELFTRSVRGTELTEAGRQLLEDAQPLLNSANMLRDRVRQAATRIPHLTVGFGQGIAIASFVRDFSERHRTVEVDLTSVEREDQAELILSERVDLCFARKPIDPYGLVIVSLFEEARVVAMPSDNPLSNLDYLEIKDLLGFHLLQDPTDVPELTHRDLSRTRHPFPSEDARRYSAGTMLETIEHVAARHGIAILPASIASSYARPDVTYCRVNGLEPSVVVVAYARDHATRDVLAMVDVAVQNTLALAAA